MKFNDKLQILRKERGLSQEKLAEILGITRQAVAKWELGQGYPDIDNLIRLSDYLKINIDRLVKTEDEHHFLSYCKKETSYDDNLVKFLCKAKRSTYAAKGAETESSRPNSHDLKFCQDDFQYIDTYLGGEKFAGEEAVWYQGNPIWSMNYQGRTLSNDFSGDFLKEALFLVPEEAPYRGPMVYQNGDYIYHCNVVGTFEWFQGQEEIFCKSVKTYECFFHGGKIK